MIPLVLVHGFMGGSAQWSGQASLSDQTPLITVDLPGFGENAHLTAPDSIAGFADFVLQDIAARGIDRFHLLGHSMGGMIVQEMVAAEPARIDHLVLYGTGARGVLPGRFESIHTSKTRARADGPRATARRIAATWFLQSEAAPAFPACAALAECSSLQAILAGLDAMENWSGVSRLTAITAPTLVLWGDRDRTYSWPQIEQLWHSIENTSLAVIPQCAHAVHLEKPALFNQILSDFLSVPAPRANAGHTPQSQGAFSAEI